MAGYRGNEESDGDSAAGGDQATLEVPARTGPRQVCVQAVDVFGFGGGSGVNVVVGAEGAVMSEREQLALGRDAADAQNQAPASVWKTAWRIFSAGHADQLRNCCTWWFAAEAVAARSQ